MSNVDQLDMALLGSVVVDRDRTSAEGMRRARANSLSPISGFSTQAAREMKVLAVDGRSKDEAENDGKGAGLPVDGGDKMAAM